MQAHYTRKLAMPLKVSVVLKIFTPFGVYQIGHDSEGAIAFGRF